MDHRAIVHRLSFFPGAVIAITSNVADADARWKPGPEHWSILEICCHLLDEEREDFRVRLRSTLASPASQWPPLDLENVAAKRSYNTRDLAQTVSEFAIERRASVAWLESLPEQNWAAAHHHPRFGPITAGDLLASWAAHDALHLRQIAKRLHNLATRDAGEYKVVYAGDWTA